MPYTDTSTEGQYSRISNNWRRYMSRLLYSSGTKRTGLTVEILLNLLEKQNYKCALSGVDLTCLLTKGQKCLTNASVDRIIPGGPYTETNIQLVCVAVNRWRADLPQSEFIRWCKLITKHQERKVNG